MKQFFISLFILSFSCTQVQALKFKDKDLEGAKVLNPIKLTDVWDQLEIHGDGVITHDWSNGFASPKGPFANSHRSFLDYRVEGHLPLYNLSGQRGRLITRIQGLGFLDERIDGFFDDPIIDMPELFWQNNTDLGDNDLRFVFGKFANRRFFNKDEINPDPFDIGEMRFSGALANTLNLLSGINEFRDDDLRPSGTREASGSYGFNFELKNQNRTGGFFKRWGYNQALAVSQLDNISNNFYGISEINKDWGEKHPGRLETGMVYANDAVFRLANNNQNTYLLYSSLAQKINPRLKFYLRYGTLFRDLNSGLSNNNEYRAGFYYDWTKKFASHHWLGYFDGESGLREDDNFLQFVNVFSYKLATNWSANFATVFRFKQFDSTTTSLEDSNFTLAWHLRYFI
ncbi:MAG: hypothetical protein O3C63_05560 [Cyanobacteria bacterium]|nr:hypothetical protein [Cyanobacteriota bacterium]MDA1020205.1 hypothetical protein [Cyanobacteriota bacterium]